MIADLLTAETLCFLDLIDDLLLLVDVFLSQLLLLVHFILLFDEMPLDLGKLRDDKLKHLLAELILLHEMQLLFG